MVSWRVAIFVSCAIASAAAVIACNSLIGLRQPAEELVEGGADDAEAGDQSEASDDAAATTCKNGETNCAGKCVVLAADPLNCGSCNHNCLDSTCASNLCTPREALPGFTAHGISGAIVIGDFELRPVFGGRLLAPFDISVSTADSVAVGGSVIFVAAPPGDEIRWITLQPNRMGTLTVDAGSVALATNQRFLYWGSSDPTAAAIVRMPLGNDGGAPATFAALQPDDHACSLAAGSDGVFWTSVRGTLFAPDNGDPVRGVTTTANDIALAVFEAFHSGVVVSTRSPGHLVMFDAPLFDNPRILVAAARATAVATDSTNVYYANGSINRVALTGGPPVLLAATTITTESRCNVPRIAVDGQYVYWVDRDANKLLYVAK